MTTAPIKVRLRLPDSWSTKDRESLLDEYEFRIESRTKTLLGDVSHVTHRRDDLTCANPRSLRPGDYIRFMDPNTDRVVSETFL